MAAKEVLSCFLGAFTGASISTLVLDVFIRHKIHNTDVQNTTKYPTSINEEKKNEPFIKKNKDK